MVKRLSSLWLSPIGKTGRGMQSGNNLRLTGSRRSAQGARGRDLSKDIREDDAVIQVAGDVGIIHARTAYTKPDGERGAGRYTDIWWRADGRWRCVSAPVTRG